MPGNKLLLFGKTFLQWQWYSLFSLPLWIWSSRHWAVVGKNGHIQLSLFRQQLGDFHGKLWGALAHSYKSKCVQRETRRQYMTQLHFCKVRAAHHGPRAAVSTVLRTQHCDSTLNTALPTPMALGFPAEGLPRRQPGQEEQVMLEGKGAPGLPCPQQWLRKQSWHQPQELLPPGPASVPGKTAVRAARGAVWVKEESKELGRLRMGLGLNAAPEMPSHRQLPTEVMHWEAAGERHGAVYYPVSCSWPTITARDMRSAEDTSVGYWPILGLEINFPFPTLCARGFSTSAKKQKNKTKPTKKPPHVKKSPGVRNVQSLFIAPVGTVLVWLAVQKRCGVSF